MNLIKDKISALMRRLYWMRERWEFAEGIPEFMEEYNKAENMLKRLIEWKEETKKPIIWKKEGF